ncbi:MAG: Na+/H+ antiporter NhaA [Pseudomonadota bacterium]
MAKKPAKRPPAASRTIDKLLSPIQAFIKTESSSGFVLIGAALFAFLWANSPWWAQYYAIQNISFGVGFGEWGLEKPLILWVNDLLMAIFFFLVGLEIKRECLVGELAGWNKASLPVAGALGGMVVPALIYVAINMGEPSIRGWGVPLATDIAFALGILALLGDRVSLSLKVFLLALAIVDDLGAVMVIALFYTDDLSVGSLLLSFVFWGVAVAYGRFGGAKAMGFALIGLVCWYFMLKSGVHATIAGVLMALAVPLRHRLNKQQLQEELRPLRSQDGDFEEVEVVIEHMEQVLHRAHSPLHSMEHGLTPYSAFLIMPVFAFFNAGLTLGGSETSLISVVSIGAFLGLLFGKPIGVAGFVAIAVMLGLTRLPPGTNWMGIIGVGLLAGIGFTMSLFIANLAFTDPMVLDQAKIGVLCASVAAAVLGLVFLHRALPGGRPAAAGRPSHADAS